MTRPIAHPRDIDAARVAQRILDENPILREKIAAATGLKGAVEGANEGGEAPGPRLNPPDTRTE